VRQRQARQHIGGAMLRHGEPLQQRAEARGFERRAERGGNPIRIEALGQLGGGAADHP